MISTRTSRTRTRRPDVPCVVRNKITGRWLVEPRTLRWSSDRDEAYRYPSRSAARQNVRTIGGAIPFTIVPA